VLGTALIVAALALAPNCTPTRPDGDTRNPHYHPGAPVRWSVGKGHLLTGVVRSSRRCRPIAHARLEVFQAGPNGRYSNGTTSWAWRATLYSHRGGSYRFQGPVPGRYDGTNPHIHIRVTAPGFRRVTTHYNVPPGETTGRLEITLRPES
jgi:protocatechuate 3,4-dioxygenase beta subunit